MSLKTMAQNKALAPVRTRQYWATVRVQFFPYGWHSSLYSFRFSFSGFLVLVNSESVQDLLIGAELQKKSFLQAVPAIHVENWRWGPLYPILWGVFRKNKTSCLKQTKLTHNLFSLLMLFLLHIYHIILQITPKIQSGIYQSYLISKEKARRNR